MRETVQLLSTSLHLLRSKPHTEYLTLGVVGVERGTSETVGRTLNEWNSGGWGICNARKVRPAGPSRHLGCVFMEMRRKRWMARPKGPSPNLGLRGKARRAEPTSPFLVTSDQHSIPHSLAIGCFQGNQYVILSLNVLAFHQTVLPPSHALILCQVARKSLKMTDFSKTRSRNIAEHPLSIFWQWFPIRLL